MAEVSSWSGYKPATEEGASPTLADYGKTFGAGTLELGASLGAGMQAAGETPGSDDTFLRGVGTAGKFLRDTLGAYAKDTVGSLTPEAKKRLESTITSSKFWAHPGSATALKATRMLPQVAAGVLPATLAIRAGQAAGIAALSSGALNATQSVDGFYDLLDEASDDDLRSSKFYREMRDAGMDEAPARSRLALKLRGNETLVNFAVGAVTGMFGPEAMLARGLKGAAGAVGAEGRGLLGRTAIGAVEGAVSGAIEEATQNYGLQQRAMEQGLQKTFSEENLVNATLEGGLLEGVIGGGVSAVAHGKQPPPKQLPPEKPITGVDQQPKGYGTGNQPAPPTDVAVGDAHNEVSVGSEREYPNKGEELKAKNAAKQAAKKQKYKTAAEGAGGALTDDPVRTVTPEIAAAIEAKAGPPVPRPEEVIEATIERTRAARRMAEEALARHAPTTTPEVTPTVTPEVTPATSPQPVQPSVGNLPPPEVAATPIQRTSELPTGSVPEPQPVRPVTAPVIAPTTRVPRILQDTSVDEETLANQKHERALEAARVKTENKVAEKQETRVANEAAGIKTLSHHGAAQKAAAATNEQASEAITREHAPVEGAKETDAVTAERAQRMVAAAEKSNVRIRKTLRKGEHATGPALILQHAWKVTEAVRNHMSATAQKERIARFRARELDARAGKVKEALSEQHAEGEIATKVKQGGNIEQVAGVEHVPFKAQEVPDAEADVAASAEKDNDFNGTRVSKSVKEGGMRVDTATEQGPLGERQKAASEVRKIAASDELKAKYAAQIAALSTKKPAEKAAPKSEALKQKVALKKIDVAAAKTETDLTQEQKENGKYEKGVADVQGIKVEIETARGEERSKQDVSGKTLWRVTMPDHYGEIQNTRGADGDKVDAYIGRDPASKTAFVIDQFNLPDETGTRAFDEHKVMLGYTHADQALAAYDKAFSDGRGVERVGSVKAMTLDELKTWLKDRNATKVPTDAEFEPEGYQALKTTEVPRILKQLAAGEIEQGEARAKLNKFDVTDGQIREALDQREAPPASKASLPRDKSVLERARDRKNEIELLRLRVRQLSRYKDKIRRAGYDIGGPRYAVYNSELRGLRERLREIDPFEPKGAFSEWVAGTRSIGFEAETFLGEVQRLSKEMKQWKKVNIGSRLDKEAYRLRREFNRADDMLQKAYMTAIETPDALAIAVDQLNAARGVLGLKTPGSVALGNIQTVVDEAPPASKASLSGLATTDEDRLFRGATHEYITRSSNGERQLTARSYGPTNVRQALNSRIIENIGGPIAKHFNLIRSRIILAAGDVPLHVVPDSEMARIQEGDTRGTALGLYDPINNVITISESAFLDRNLSRTLLHEAIHAATSRALYSDPFLRETVKLVMADVESAHPEWKSEYGFIDAHEFLAEALSNPDFQSKLQTVLISRELARALGMQEWRKNTVWEAIVETIRAHMGLPREVVTALEAALRVTELSAETKLSGKGREKIMRWQAEPAEPAPRPSLMVSSLQNGVLEHAKNVATEYLNRPDRQSDRSAPRALTLRTLDQLAQVAENYFGGNNPVRVIADTIERIRTTAEKLLDGTAPLMAKQLELEKKYAGPVWDKYADLMQDETLYGVYADVSLDHEKNKHLHFKGVEHLGQIQSRAKHKELNETWKSLPEDLKALRTETHEYYKRTQEQMSEDLVKNRVLKALGVQDAALAKRVFEGRATESDEKLLGKDTLKDIAGAMKLAKLKGPYVPMMRRGTHVVKATLKIEPPTSTAKKISDNEFEFAGKNARDEAAAFARKQDSKAEVQSVWVGKTTGETHAVENDTDGNPVETKISPQDVDAENRFRVTVQNRHIEFHESAKEAYAAAEGLSKNTNFTAVDDVEMRQYEPQGRDRDVTSAQVLSLMHSLQQRKGYRDMSAGERHEVQQALQELAIRSMGSTRIQSRRLPRRYVGGASNDLSRNMYDYAYSASAYLARLEHAPVLESAVKDMLEGVKGDYATGGSIGRSSIAVEVQKRLDAPLFDEAKGWHAWTKRLMTVSFLDKLFGPSHSIINATQPAMVSFPVLAARHGPGRAFTELRRAYSDIGGLRIVAKGAKDTYSKARGQETTGFLGDIVARAAKTDGERAMFEHLAEVGSISPDSGMEIDALKKSQGGVLGKLDTGLGYVDSIARQMPRAIESMNRASVALAAYRLELARLGSTPETQGKAVRYAQETVNNTQFLYSITNRPKIFNHPLARLALQFKQYGQGMYHLIGMNIGRALHDASPEVRKEAIKTLVMIAATHMAMAGALGLPLEPFKYLLMGANATGLVNTSWNDVEDMARRIGAALFGKTVGELVTKGLPRAIGVDVSSRMGLDSLTSFGEPRSNKDTDVKSWLFDTIAGAPVALLGDWVKGSHALIAGNFAKAAELLVPTKVLADALRAYRQSSEGKKSATGRETMTPYTPTEALTRVMGFTPAREAEQGAQRGAFYGKQTRAKDDRQNLIGQWATAKPDEKGRAWTAIVAWNKGQPEQQRIKMSELSTAAKRRVIEEKSTGSTQGIRTNKRDKFLLDNSPYVTGGPR